LDKEQKRGPKDHESIRRRRLKRVLYLIWFEEKLVTFEYDFMVAADLNASQKYQERVSVISRKVKSTKILK
jgi:hypothetical protein